jgi:LuxR family maltose regulon positive regulatory protein
MLLRRLDQSLTRPLVVLVAPAGAGKSILLHQWDSARPDLKFVWLPLDPTDNGPVRFSQRLLQGLAGVNPDISDLAPLVSLHGGGLGTPLLEALEHHLEGFPGVVIVLDNLHHLSNPALVNDLGRLVDLFPPQVHLVLSTRIDPPLALTRHRLRRDLTEFRQSDLALDETESSQLLERVSGRHVPADSVALLVNRTEGWAAGLQLAGMTLRLNPDSETFITEFSGDDRLVADYLSQEVLDAQSARRRRLMLRVSVLDEICADLVRLLTGEPNAQLILDELERESMFLVALDTRREWFRFHHLFRDLLRYRLQAEDPPTGAVLLQQAADWHLARGQVDVGIEYLLRAEAWDAALDVIVTSGSGVFERGEMTTAISWIRRIPEAVRSGRHQVNLLLAVLLIPEGHAAEAEGILRQVATDAGASAGEQACALCFLSALAQWRPRPEASITAAERALAMLADLGDGPIPDLLGLSDRSSLETMVMISGGRAHFLAGHIGRARDWLERALVTVGSVYSVWRVHGLGSLALLEAWSGRTARAEALVKEALGVAKDVGLLSHPSTADAYLALSLIALERGEPRRAALSLSEGALRAEANRRSQLSWIGHVALAMLQAADTNIDQAIATILSSADEAWVPPPPIVADRLLALHARLLRFTGAPDQALRVGDGGTIAAPLAAQRAAAALELGRIDQARKHLEPLLPLDAAAEPRLEIERLLLQAQLAAAEGFPGEASVLLAEAMSVGQRHSLVDVFVWAGAPVVEMLSAHREHAAFRDVILTRARQVRTPTLTARLVDPLTDREMEVLTYLPSRLTNAELAERCFVSVNTIKTHMAHIYQKLAVPNRTEAITRAQELGLL